MNLARFELVDAVHEGHDIGVFRRYVATVAAVAKCSARLDSWIALGEHSTKQWRVERGAELARGDENACGARMETRS